MTFKKYTLVSLILFLTASYSSYGQGVGRKLYPGQTRSRGNSSVPISRSLAYPWTWTAGLGTASYFGQLCPTGNCFLPDNIQFNIGLRYRFTTRISIQGSLRYFGVGASDNSSGVETGRPERNLSFKTTGYEAQVYGLFDFIPIISRFMGDKSDQYNRRNFFVPYGIVGVGVLLFDPQAKNLAGQYVSLANLPTSQEKVDNGAYSTITPIATLGVGCRVKLTEFLDLGADLTYTSTFTDNLDDVAGGSHYPTANKDPTNSIWGPGGASSDAWYLADPNLTYIKDPSDLTKRSDPNGLPRGGPNHQRDGYFILNVRIDYTLSKLTKFASQKTHRHFQKGKAGRHHKFDRK